MNPYRAEKRAADTLNLIMEGRLQFRLSGHSAVNQFVNRRWRTVGGHVGWHEALIRYANLFLDAGLIDYQRPAGRVVDEFYPGMIDSWEPVFATQAGRHLLKMWRDEPFRVVPVATVPSLVDEVAEILATAYVRQSGLLEDDRHRYVEPLRPHAEQVVSDLLNVHKVNGGWR